MKQIHQTQQCQKIKLQQTGTLLQTHQRMEIIQQKDLIELKEIQQKQKIVYKNMLEGLLNNEELRILIEYSAEQFDTIEVDKIQNINEYSAVSISRLVYADELSQIKQQLAKLPKGRCPQDNFVLIMLRVIKFPFDKVPFYLLGLRQMFRQIKSDQKSQYVIYEQIQNYLLGEVVDLADNNKNDTQFQIQFVQNKMQDFLMHDNGIKKIFYSHDLQKYLVLDFNSNQIKIYDLNMKIFARFQPNKEKHQKKKPQILTFDYNEFGSKLALSLSNKTLCLVHLGNFLAEPLEQKFRAVFLNEIVYKSPKQIVIIKFLSMMNKWLCIDESNEIWIYDIQTFKQDDEKYCTQFNHPNDDYQVNEIHQIISLSALILVIKNQIWFFDERLTKKKFNKFSHCEEILKLIYDEEKTKFYLVGKNQKYITMLTFNKSIGEITKIQTLMTNQIITNFQNFSFFNTLLILDIKNNLKVYNLQNQLLQHQQNFDNIVKKKDHRIQLTKCSKTSFLIHATYIIVMELKKVAIETDIDYLFDETFFYNSNRQEIIFSVNAQIIGLSIIHGQIRKSIAPENSNIDKHKAFHMAKNTEPFIIDERDSLYQVLYKSDLRYKEYKDYRKNVGITNVKKSFYDDEYKMVLMISEQSIYLVRNDSQNNFTFKSCLLFENSPLFMKYKYNKRSKHLIFLDSANTVYLMKSYNFKFDFIFTIGVFKEWNESQKMVLDMEYQEQLQILMVLTSNGEFIIFNLNDCARSMYIRIKDCLPYKLQSLAFTSFSYQKFEGQGKSHYPRRIFFYNQSGFIIELEIESMLQKIISNQQNNSRYQKIFYLKQTHQIDVSKYILSHPPALLHIQKSSLFNLEVKHSTFIKVHQKPISFAQRILLEDYHLLTIGEDGHVKLWGQNRKLYFDLKLPLMLKIQWNMNQIHLKRSMRMIKQTNQFLEQMTQIIKNNQQKSILNRNFKKKIKNKSQKIKLNLDNPITIEFQNKDLEQIVMNKKYFDFQYNTIDVLNRQKKEKTSRMGMTQRINEPWKKKIQFKQIFQKAASVDKYVPKYKQKMPFDLILMRNDLHMDRTIKPVYSSKTQQKIKNQQLIILPELKNYLKIKELEVNNDKAKSKEDASDKEQESKNLYNPEDQNKFQSCLFVKTERGHKKGNAFDEIDRYFWKKNQQWLNKKWIPNKKNLKRQTNTFQPKTDNSLSSYSSKNSENSKIDPVKQIIKIFEQHNREALCQKRGRLIKIPRMQKSTKKFLIKKS